MNFRPQFSLLALLCVAFSAHGMELAKREVNTKNNYAKSHFSLLMDGKTTPIQRCFVDKDIRDLSPAQVKRFVDNGGYLKLRELRNKYGVEYGLQANGRLKGGGPILGAVTFVTGTLATAAATTVAVIVTIPAGPVAMAAVAVTATHGGMAATTYAAVVATGLPTP